MSPRIASIAAAVICAVTPLRTSAAPNIPLVDEVSHAGAHWVAWRFQLPVETRVAYEVQIQGGEDSRQAAFTQWLIGDNGLNFTIITLENTANGGSHLQTIATGVLIDEPGVPMTVDDTTTVVHRLPAATYRLVLAWDGADLGTGRLYSESAMQVLGRSDGASVSWSPQREFDGVLNADLNGSGATVAGSTRRDISESLFGVFLKFPGRGIEVMSYTGPSVGIAADDVVIIDSRGPTVSAAVFPFFVFNGTPSGRYDFSVLGGVHQQGGVTLFTADVALP